MIFITARLMTDQHIANVQFESALQRASFGLSILSLALLGALLIWLKTDILMSRADLEKQLFS